MLDCGVEGTDGKYPHRRAHIGITLNVMTYEQFSSGMTRLANGLLLVVFVLLQRILSRARRS